MRVVGWSPERLAPRINRALGPSRRDRWVTPSAVYKWRDHNAVPREPLPAIVAGVLAEALGEPLTVDQLWQGRAAASELWVPADFGLDLAWTQTGTVELLNVVRGDQVERRQFLPIAGLPLLTPALEWEKTEPGILRAVLGGDRVTPKLLNLIESDVRTLGEIDDDQSSAFALDRLLGEYQFVARVVRNGTYDVNTGIRLLTALAELARLTAFQHFDRDQHGAAQRYYLTAMRVSHAAGDRLHSAHSLVLLSWQIIWREGSPRDALALLESAHRGAGGLAPHGLLGTWALIEARAHGLAGDSRAAGQALNRAQRLIAASKPEDNPSYVSRIGETLLNQWSGQTLAQLGDHRRAADLLAGSNGQLGGEGWLRDKAVGLPFLARTQLRRRDLDAACASAAEAFRLGTELGSARALNGVRSFRAEVARHTGVSAVNDFLDATAALVAA